jgi:hypothetical protein
MPAAIKRRKLSTIPRNASSPTSKPQGIATFARVSKATATSKAIIEKNNYVDTVALTLPEEASANDRKRKLGASQEESTTEQSSAILPPAINHRDVKPLPRRSNDFQRIPHTPQKALKNTDAAASIETPTKGARSLLDRLFLSSKTPTRFPLREASNSSTLDNNTQGYEPQSTQALPAELLDLINLHAAFLTALSIHYAHNGTSSPADLQILCPNVARAWGKRRVLLEDIRRTLGVLNANIEEENRDSRLSHLSLSDYGHGKICIEIDTYQEKAGRLARPVNEDLLNEIFVGGLRNTWDARWEVDMKPREFIESLPLEPITICSSVTKMSPLLAKGQRRLEDLRAGITVKKAAAKEKVLEQKNGSGTKPTLLERLRAKQLHQSTLPPPPSKAELDRKQALQRIDEVVAVLTILSTSSSVGQQRISFTMPTVLGKLKDSFRTPISKEEGDICVRLLASEIAPEWVKIAKMGKVEAIVVNRDERPQEQDIRKRVRRAA